MAYTQAQLTALQNALAKGVLEVRDGDKTVKYASLAELERRIALIKEELGLVQPRGRRFVMRPVRD